VLLLLAAACRTPDPHAPAVDAPAAPARPPVGITSRVYDDRAPDRRLAVTIWYPAPPGTVEETTNFDGIFPGRGAWEAPVRTTPARMPLALLSHGSGGDAANLAWLAEALAGQGWIAAAVDHPGDRFGDQSPEGRFAVWRRAPDLTVALTGLLADRTLGPRIDRRRIAGDSYRDPRVRAVAAMSPVMGLAATSASLRAIHVPVDVIASPSDELVPFEQNAARYARLIPHAQLPTVPDAGHFVFMPVCTLPGRLVAAAACVDIATAPDRAAVHAETAAGIERFFRRALGTRSTR